MFLLTPTDWDHRFSQQARWTKDIRSYLFDRVNLLADANILDVGCGTGVILKELAVRDLTSFGLDISAPFLNLAINAVNTTSFTQGDAHQLPYPNDTFNLSMCHFTLMWVENPNLVLDEMTRVTRPDGVVLALAEPDYGGRIDHPPALKSLGEWQTESLRSQGADPLFGRRLSGLFNEAGLHSVETGVLGGQWSGEHDWNAWRSEWNILESDMAMVPKVFDDERISKLKELDKESYLTRKRVLFVPTFFAWGIVG
jgi:SAM-dependent methyltransferase